MKEVRKLLQLQAHEISEDEYDEKYLAQQEQVMRRAYGALRLVRLLFTNHSRAKAVEVPEWLYKAIIYEF